MKQSLGKKVCWIGTLLILAFVIINMVLTYFFMAPFSSFFYREQMATIGKSIQKISLENKEDFETNLEMIDEDRNVKVTVMDKEKTVYYTTKAFLKEKSQYWKLSMELFDSERKTIEQEKPVFLTRKRQGKNNKHSIQVIMIQKIAENRYIVMSRSYQSLQNAMYTALIFEMLVGILLVIVGWVVTYRLSHRLIVPIEKMTITAERIANLDFDSRVEVTTMDEIGQLGNSINKMSEQLEKNLTQMQEDIENRKRLVRNLSHEMKTPMAVIMGYADRLKVILTKNPEKALEYCDIISNESTRVDMLVKEMLDFAKLEEKVDVLNRETISAKNFFETLATQFQQEKPDVDISYNDSYRENDVIVADNLLLNRAVTNLIRNAVTHSALQSFSIQVSGERKGEYYEIKVYNTGSSIAETELTSIWEPFSKVDKVRTRGKQGYGLGLSIVREIIEAHEGYYKVRNVEDGVEFLIAVKG